MAAAKKKTGTAPKKDRKPTERIDLQPTIAEVLATFPEGFDIEVSGVSKKGKRVDLIRKDGVIVRLETGLRTIDAQWYLKGIAKGRTIE